MCEHFQLTCVEIRFCCKLQQFCCSYYSSFSDNFNHFTEVVSEDQHLVTKRNSVSLVSLHFTFDKETREYMIVICPIPLHCFDVVVCPLKQFEWRASFRCYGFRYFNCPLRPRGQSDCNGNRPLARRASLEWDALQRKR